MFVFAYIYAIACRLDRKQDTYWMNVRLNKYLKFDQGIIPALRIKLVKLLNWLKDNCEYNGEVGTEGDDCVIDCWSKSVDCD